MFKFLKKLFGKKPAQVVAWQEPVDDRPLSDPYVLQIENNSTERRLVALFGFNWNNDAPNNGLGEDVRVCNLQIGGYDGYTAMLAQLQENPVLIGKWRFQSSTPKNLTSTIQIWDRDANGEQHIYPLNLACMLDAYQQQSSVLDVTKCVPVDGNMTIVIPVEAGSRTVISMYPVKKRVTRVGDPKRNPSLEDLTSERGLGEDLDFYKAPRLSGKTIAPLIINTRYPFGKITNKMPWYKRVFNWFNTGGTTHNTE